MSHSYKLFVCTVPDKQPNSYYLPTLRYKPLSQIQSYRCKSLPLLPPLHQIQSYRCISPLQPLLLPPLPTLQPSLRRYKLSLPQLQIPQLQIPPYH